MKEQVNDILDSLQVTIKEIRLMYKTIDAHDNEIYCSNGNPGALRVDLHKHKTVIKERQRTQPLI